MRIYSIVRYTNFGIYTDIIASFGTLSSALNECRYYGDDEDIESGYYVEDTEGTCWSPKTNKIFYLGGS